jgi:prephenate dehydratase
MPIIDKPFQYSFFVDVTFSKYENFEKAKSILEIMTTHFKLLGEYESGILPLKLKNKEEKLIVLSE